MEQLMAILQDVCPDVNFENREDLVDARVIDSFDILQIISEIDSVFDVIIPAEEIIPENFNSAEKLYTLINRLIND